MGIIIDEVYEVDDIPTSDIKDVPEFGTKVNKRFISKMAKYKGEYIPILNTQAILDIKELSQAVE
jgi:purine-binding chemotaxis protein CheW